MNNIENKACSSRFYDFFNARTFQTTLLVLTVSLAALSLVPSVGRVASLALRMTALATVGSLGIYKWTQEGAGFASFAKIIPIACGIIGVIFGIQPLIIFSFAASALISGIEIIRDLTSRSKNFLTHLGFLAINILGLTALITGHWQIVVAASAVSAFVLGALAIISFKKAKNRYDVMDAICYLALAVINIAGAVRAAELVRYKPNKAFFSIQNDTNEKMALYDKKGDIIAQLEPREQRTIAVPIEQTDQKWFGDAYIYRHISGTTNRIGIENDWFTYEKSIFQKPYSVAQFPTLPIGSTHLTGKKIS